MSRVWNCSGVKVYSWVPWTSMAKDAGILQVVPMAKDAQVVPSLFEGLAGYETLDQAASVGVSGAGGVDEGVGAGDGGDVSLAFVGEDYGAVLALGGDDGSGEVEEGIVGEAGLLLD